MKSLSKLLTVGVAIMGLGLTAVSFEAQAYCCKRVVVKHVYHTGCCNHCNTCNYCNTCGYYRNYTIWPFF